MSCSPCGYSYSSNPQLLMTGQHPSLHYPAAAPAGSMAPDGPGGLLPYDGRLLSYSRLPELYAATYPDPVAGYMAGHHAVLYPPGLASPYDIKDPRTAWSTLPQAGTYDPILAAYSPYGDRFDPVDSEARRRNATRETTSTLKAWLNEHRKNPYPTKGEKIMLAIITKMTLTQVSTWFANARRRLKKENKMTWEPRNKTGDDLDDVSSDDEEPKDAKSDATDDTENLKTSDSSSRKRRHSSECEAPSSPLDDPDQKRLKSSSSPELTDLPSPVLHKPTTPEKPKIWSLAQTATSDSPPKQFPETSFSSSHHQFLHRNRLDSSADSSSTSSPPLWRTTPLDPCGDHMGSSASPSSTGSSSAVVVTTGEQGSSPSGYGRRFDALQRPMDYASYYSSGLAPPSIDMRTFHPHHHHPYLRPSSYYAVGFTCAPPAVYHNHPPVTTISKSKSGEGNASRIES